MRTAIYMPKNSQILVGHNLVDGVAPNTCIHDLPACTIFVDSETGEVAIDTNHTIPKSWLVPTNKE